MGGGRGEELADHEWNRGGEEERREERRGEEGREDGRGEVSVVDELRGSSGSGQCCGHRPV